MKVTNTAYAQMYLHWPANASDWKCIHPHNKGKCL